MDISEWYDREAMDRDKETFEELCKQRETTKISKEKFADKIIELIISDFDRVNLCPPEIGLKATFTGEQLWKCPSSINKAGCEECWKQALEQGVEI